MANDRGDRDHEMSPGRQRQQERLQNRFLQQGGQFGQDRINAEKLQILDGSRSDKVEVLRQRAVRIDDLTGILQMPAELQSGLSLGPNPTQNEHDRLYLDVVEIHKYLMIVAAALQKQIKP